MNKPTTIERFVSATIALIAWFGLILQFYLIMFEPTDMGISASRRFVNFFSYFTVSTNLVVAISLTISTFSPSSAIGQFFSRASTRTAVAVYITVVGLVYSLILRSIWDPSGLSLIADRTLHDVVPVLYVLYWLIFVRTGRISWAAPVWWLIYPLVYLVYSIVRGAIVDWYPYPFADVSLLGYPAVLRNAALVMVAFFIIGIIFVGIGKLPGRTAKATTN